jgi:2-desacetyl-2-hydroxyethyl bacteriochlorophyllide A dehydrogenase
MKTRPMAIVTQPGIIEFQERPLPDLGPQEVRVKVKAVSICGSDLHIFKGKHPAAPLPVPVGHELSGVVDRIGEEVTKLKTSDRVAIEPVIACGACHFCLRGQYHLCTQISFQYRVGQGGFTPYFIVSEEWAHRLPDNISFAEGALVEPLSVAVHAARISGIGLGDTSAIFGAGAIGLLLLQLIRASGGGDAFVVDVQDQRLQKASELGATHVLNNLSGDTLAKIMEHSGGLGVDFAFEAVGLEVTLVQSLQALKKGGTAVLVGLFEQPEIKIPANIFVQKEIKLLGSQGYCWDFQTALTLLSGGQINLKSMITHEFPLSQLQDAFNILMDPQGGAIKVVIKVDE